MSRLGGKEAFDEAREDLEALAGIVVQTKQVERVSEAIGEQIEAIHRKERTAALAGKVVLLHSTPKMYVAIDGTGVPMVPRETKDRPGKDGVGPAKTREVKLGCVFTQTGPDEKGRPARDQGSTTYVGAIETSEEFGGRIFAEAIHRGSRRADKTIVLVRRLQPTGALRGLRSHRGRLQDHRRAQAQTVRNALDRPWRQRHRRPALL